MGGRQVLRVVHMEALAVWFHDVARKTELSAFCVFQFAGGSNSKQRSGNANSARNAIIFTSRPAVL